MPEAPHAAPASELCQVKVRTPRVSKERFRRGTKERYEMLDACDTTPTAPPSGDGEASQLGEAPPPATCAALTRAAVLTTAASAGRHASPEDLIRSNVERIRLSGE